jgi:multimeric flavodoxin WrbA
MSRRLLILTGSPRRAGNSEYLAGMAAEAAEAAGAEAERVSLAAQKILPCTACDLCHARKAKYCVIHDDMDGLYAKVLGADALLFITPVYWFSLGAQIKLFIDRLYGLWNWDNGFIRGKKVGAVLVYGDEDIYSSGGVNALGSFEHMFRFLGADYEGAAYGTANDPEDAKANADLVERTRTLALRLL